MPLCPQITITPVTVTSTGMTQTSIIPIVAATTEETDELQVEINSIEASVNGKNHIYRQATAPDGSVYPLTEGDVWFDTDDGNKQYYWTGTAWVSVQDAGIAAAEAGAAAAVSAAAAATAASAAATAAAAAAASAATAAQSTADGKNRVYRQATVPTAGPFTNGDLWFDTDADNKTYRYSAASTSSINLKSLTSNVATLTTTAAHLFVPGQPVSISGVGVPFDGSYTIATVPTTTTFTYARSNSDIPLTAVSPVGSATSTAGFYEVLYGNNSLANLSANKLTSGSIDAGVITVSNLNAGNISTGVLNADRIQAASITGAKLVAGTIEAVSIAAGTITGAKLAVGTIEAVSIAAGTITGAKIAAGTIVASNIATATITADQIAGGTITAAEIAADTITAAEIAAGSITVDRLTAGTLTAFTLQTSSGTRRVTVSASTNSISFREAGTVVGHIGPASIDGIVMHFGSTFNPAVTTYPNTYVSSGDARMAFSSTKYVQVSTTGVVVSGDFFSLTNFYNQDTTTTANAANTWMSATNGLTRRSTASSQRYKENIVGLRTVVDLDPAKLLELPVRAFTYKTDYLDSADDRAGLMLPGFIAEEVAEIYPIAADKVDGVVESWNDRFVVPGMLALIQDLHARVTTLEGGTQ